MSIKRKFRRNAKVIPLHDTLHLCCSPGVHILAEDSGLPLDELFLSLLQLVTHGFMKVDEELTENDQPRLLAILSENDRDVDLFRKELVTGSLIDPSDLPAWYELRDVIFPDLPPPAPNMWPIFHGGIHSILDLSQFDIDFVFLSLFRLTIHGLIQPIVEKVPSGRSRLNFKMAINELDIKSFRNLFLQGYNLVVTDLPAWRMIRDDFLGKVEPEPDDYS